MWHYVLQISLKKNHSVSALIGLCCYFLGNSITAFAQHDSSDRIEDVVITGTLNSVKLSESPVHVDIYQKRFFTQNPTPNLFDALQLASGVRPQVNCNICATGDIHFNGMEGPYTMILIDGMPIVSSLASVYGLMGIPSSMIDRIEIVKGPASSLYGSEAMGGLINVILKKDLKERASIELWSNTWGETNVDASLVFNLNKNWRVFTGINGFWNDLKKDVNQDGFTDIALQKRVSLFQQWQRQRPRGKRFDFAFRAVAEDRWGGQLAWKPAFRGGDSVYGESIQTQRLEWLNTYDFKHLPLKWQASAVLHQQQSAYGTMIFDAHEYRWFSQLLWQPQWKQHRFLVGAAYRYTYYDDNTVLTERIAQDSNRIPKPQITPLPGIFFQDEWRWQRHTFLIGSRGDFHSEHRWIGSYRIAWKIDAGNQGHFRINGGTGFRTVNIFTEEHAALTGSRRIVMEDKIQPEASRNWNISWNKTWTLGSSGFLQSDFHVFHTVFSNRIVPDYDKSHDAIYYRNSAEGAINQGLTWNIFWQSKNGLSMRVGATWIDAQVVRNTGGKPERPFLTERMNGTFAVQWTSPEKKWEWNYNGNLVSPMRLPLASEWDPRPAFSPWWSIQNLHFSRKFNAQLEVFGGIQNLWNWTPNSSVPFLLARAHDPFDKQIISQQGEILRTSDNPYGLSFDASYVYAPNQGRRYQFGIRVRF